jgi:Tfp pilus assembly protein PilX
MNTKGVAFILVLTFILAVVIMANIALVIISSQTRLTHHQISRIHAIFAAEAGINYALAQLNTGAWGTGSYTICKSGCDFDDGDIPFPVNINISDPNSDGVRQIDATSNYTY